MDESAALRALGLPARPNSAVLNAVLSKAYRRAALEAHPDKGGDSTAFQRVSDAYAFLSASSPAPAEAQAPPERLLRYRVSGKKGCLVRVGVGLDSAVVGSLARGDLATVFESEGRAEKAATGDKVRLRVAFPLNGWVSASTVQEEMDYLNGEPATLKAAIRRAGRKGAAAPASKSFKDFLAAGKPAPPGPPPAAPAPIGGAPPPLANPTGVGQSFAAFATARKASTGIRDLAPNCRLYPDVLTPSEAADLYLELRSAPWRTETDEFGVQGRETFYCGDDGCDFAFCGLRLAPKPWPAPLFAVRDKVGKAIGVNHYFLRGCLCNDYGRGEGHIPWHADEVRAHGHAKTVASLSLGGSRLFRLRDKATGDLLAEVDLPPGSVLLMSGDAQAKYEHELPLLGPNDPERTSCTFRSIVPGFEDAWDKIHNGKPFVYDKDVDHHDDKPYDGNPYMRPNYKRPPPGK